MARHRHPQQNGYPAFEHEDAAYPSEHERRRWAWESLGTFLFGFCVGMVAIAVVASLMILVLV